MAKRPKLQIVSQYCKKAAGKCSSFFASLLSRHSRVGGNPVTTSLRGAKATRQFLSTKTLVIPLKKGIQTILKKMKLFRMELLYLSHLRLRLVHDTAYHKSPVYKKVSDSSYTRPVRNATVSAFFVSLFIFLTAQYILPQFNLFTPGKVQAGSNNYSWTSQGDFTNNGGVTGPILNSNILASAGSNISLTPSGILGTGVDGPLVVDGTTAANNTLNGVLIPGGPFNSTTPLVLDTAIVRTNRVYNFTSVTLQGNAVMTHTAGIGAGTAYAGITLKTTGTFSLTTGSSINVDGKGYNTGGPGAGGSAVALCTSTCQRGGGGGGGYGTSGVAGVSTYNGAAGGTAGVVYSTIPALGSNGGSNGGDFYIPGSGIGGKGGGSVSVAAGTASINGSISSKGTNGSNGGVSGTDYIGGGGGGSGGYIGFVFQNGSFSSSYLSAAAGNGGTGWTTGNGGNGGVGRITVSGPTITGTPGSGSTAYVTGVFTGFLSPGTLGGISTSIGLRTNLSPTVNYLWSSIKSTVDGDPTTAGQQALMTGQAVKYLVRTSTNGTSWQIYDRDGVAVLDANIETAWTNKYLGQTVGGTLYETFSSSIPPTSYAEVLVRLESNGGNTPQVDDVTLGYDTLEAPINANLALSRTDGTYLRQADGTLADTAIGVTPATGHASFGTPALWSNQTTLRVTANNLTCGGGASGQTACTTPSTNLRPEVEIKPVGTNFATNPVSGTDTVIATVGNIYVDIPNLNPGTGYHLRVRATDSQGRASGWTSYGTNAESAADVMVEQTAPTVASFQLNSGATYASSRIISATGIFSDLGNSSPNGTSAMRVQFSQNGTDWGTINGTNDGNLTSTDWTNFTYITPQASPTTVSIVNGQNGPIVNSVQTVEKTWYLTGADSPPNKTVYIRTMDMAGNISGTWTQTNQVDFSGGATTNTDITTVPGTIKLSGTSSGQETLRPDGAGSLTQLYSSSGPNWSAVDDITPDGGDSSVQGMSWDSYDFDLYTTNHFIPSGSTINSVTIYVNYIQTWQCAGGSQPIIKDTTGTWVGPDYGGNYDWFVTQSTTRTTRSNGTAWTLADIDVLEIGASAYFDSNSNVPSGVSQVYAVVDWTHPPSSSGNFTSAVKNNTSAQNYGKISWSANVPAETGANALRFQVAANNDNSTWNFTGPAGNAGTYYASGDQLWSGLDGKQYIRYKAFLQNNGNTAYTPTVYDVSIGVNTTTSDSITLDTAIPTGTVAVRDTASGFATSKDVTLNLEASDEGPSGLKDFALSNDGTNWSAWTNWSDTYRAAGVGYSWALADGDDGARTVYVKYRDNAGNVGGETSPGANWTVGQAEAGYTDTLKGKYVDNTDVGSFPWKNSRSGCDGTHCSTTVAPAPDLDYPSNMVLVDPIANPGVVFGATYPAQEACKVRGGRLPTMNELKAIYTGKGVGHYGNFANNWYWSATENDSETARYLLMTNKSLSTAYKNSSVLVRCVGDMVLSSAISSSLTLDTALPVTTLNVNPDSPNGDNPWYKTAKPTVSFSASDAGSKVDKLSYRFDTDAAPYTEVANTNTDQPYVYNLDAANLPEGQHTLYYFATDKAGSTEIHLSQAFNIDVQSPTTGYAISPELPNGQGDWYVTTAPDITLTGTDPNGGSNSGVANTYYQWTAVGGTPIAGFNANPALGWATYTVPIPAAQGDKTLHYYTKDTAGNVSTTSTQHIKFNAYMPDIPTNFKAPKAEATLTTIKIYWDAVSNDPTGIAVYNLQRRKRTPSLGAWAPISTGGCSGITGSGGPCVDNSGLETGFQYGYKIQAVDAAGIEGNWSEEIFGYTTDTVSPSLPSGVTATACDGTVGTCPATDADANPNTKGFAIKVAWSPSTDTSGALSRYIVYRKMAPTDYLSATDWTVVGEVDATSAPSNPVFYDNDGSDAPTKLNDATSYYYRITALDGSTTGNPTLLVDGNDMFGNLTSLPGTTPDVTAPGWFDSNGQRTNDAHLVASAMSIDANPASILPEDPVTDPQVAILHQRIRLTWSAASDVKARSADTTSNTITYHIYKLNPINDTYEEIGTTTSITYNVDSLQDFTDYYFKVNAEDSSTAHNTSAQSNSATKRTASSAVPTVPTEVTVTSKKGDPTDTAVGHEVTVTFFGSYAKNCDPTPDIRCLVKYEVYRSTINYADDADWLVSGNAAKIAEVTPRVKGNDRKLSDNDTPYSVTDTGQTYPATSAAGLSAATEYYYKVRALDNTPADPDGGPYYSPMTAVTVGTLHQGWDMTPDDEAPNIPAGGLEVKVRDTHPNEVELRNIITWKVLTSATEPKRDGVSDFAKYIVHRETYNPTTDALMSDDIVYEQTDMTVNYYMDVIGIAFVDLKYKYYIQIEDDAGTNFVYPNTATVINQNFSNLSAKEYAPDSIIPSKAKPLLTAPVTLSNIGVASAEVSWTTNQDADSIVQFRPLGSTGDWMIDGRVERTVNHNVRLVSLTPSTTYEYLVISRNYLGNNVEAWGTLPELRTTGFDISNIAYTATTTAVTLTWNTNIWANGNFVEYQMQGVTNGGNNTGPVGQNMSPVLDSQQVLRQNLTAQEIQDYLLGHTVYIGGLKSSQTYSFKLKSISTDGYITYSDLGTFTTRSFDTAQFSLAPTSSNVADRNITSTTAQIVWQTAVPTTSWIEYGSASGSYGTSAGDNALTMVHVVTLEGLTPGTKYYYRARVKDINDVEYTSPEYSFTAILKPKISNMTVKNVTPYSATVSWDTNVDTETIINWGKTAAYGEKRGKSGLSKVHELVIDKLDDNQEYHYQILAKDDAGNEVADTDKIIRTPLDTEGPKITGVKIDVLPMGESDTTSSIIVSWQTNKPATTLVEYDEGVIGGTYGKRSVEDTTLNNSHTVIIKGLAPASSYHYRLVSADKRNNKTISQDYTFVTPSKEKSILQLILKSLEETFAWTRNLNQFFGNIGKRLTGK